MIDWRYNNAITQHKDQPDFPLPAGWLAYHSMRYLQPSFSISGLVVVEFLTCLFCVPRNTHLRSLLPVQSFLGPSISPANPAISRTSTSTVCSAITGPTTTTASPSLLQTQNLTLPIDFHYSINRFFYIVPNRDSFSVTNPYQTHFLTNHSL